MYVFVFIPTKLTEDVWKTWETLDYILNSVDTHKTIYSVMWSDELMNILWGVYFRKQ